jgi:glycosyltransferase involved in cell wall biosynthesis
MSSPKISVVVPALNEARNIPYVFARMPTDIYEVILVDGFSADDTVAVARQQRPDVRIVAQTRQGKGNALACGLAAATGDIVAMVDADGSADPGEIPRFVAALLEGADFAKGTRFLEGGGSSDITRLRSRGNYFLTMFFNMCYGRSYSDLCYGFNVFWRRHVPALGLDATSPLSSGGNGRLWGDGFEVETLIHVRVAKAGLIVAEVPSFEHPRIHGVSNLNAFRDGLRVLRTILSERHQGRRPSEVTDVMPVAPSGEENLSAQTAESPPVLRVDQRSECAPLSVNEMHVTRTPTISVIIAAFSMNRWKNLCEAVASVQAQAAPVLETIVVIDHNPCLLERARNELLGVTVLANDGGRGASAARNTGVATARAELVAFLDDDAIASPLWLEALLTHFAEPNVIGVGGRLDALWAISRPRWFPPEFDWVVGASYLGMPTSAKPVRNVWSNNMSIRREVFNMVGGFREDFGKVGARSRPEDTDLCIRAAAGHGNGTWIFEPMGAADHWVPVERATLRYFAYRCFNEGWGKAALAKFNGMESSMSSERFYTRHVLPSALARGLKEAFKGNASGGLRNFALIAGFTAVVIGFLVGYAVLLIRAPGIRRRHRRSSTASAGSEEYIL